MRAYERRATGKLTYFNLDRWDTVRGCWVKNKRQYDTERQARAAAKQPGRYRLSRSTDGTRTEFEPFVVSD
jgi:hypothetical protein